MTMPAQRPGSSEQTVQTPRAFLDAVEREFGPLTFDLAADPATAICPDYYGPGSPSAQNSLLANWPRARLCWLNPPYGLIKGDGFARKARLEAAKGSQLIMLIPASVATNWFADEIHGHALVRPIRPRLTFVGHKDPYPKDLMICAYGPYWSPGFDPWAWR